VIARVLRLVVFEWKKLLARIARVLRLVVFEWRKLFARRFTWIALAIIILAAAVSPLVGQVLTRAEQLQREGAGADSNVPSGWTALAAGVKFGTNVATFVLLILAGSSIAEESQQGTLKTVLLRPVFRIEVLLAKEIALSLFAVVLVVVMGVAAGLASARYEWGSLVSQGGKDAPTLLRYTIGAFALSVPPLFAVVGFGLLFSCAIDHAGYGTGAAIGGYGVLSTIAGLSTNLWRKIFVSYVGLHFDQLKDMGEGTSAASKVFRELAPEAVIVSLVSAAVFFAGAAVLLRMRDVSD
jgi:ABC-2 type transport system permease protein